MCGCKKKNAKKTCVLNDIGLHAQNMLTILSSTLNTSEGDIGPLWPFIDLLCPREYSLWQWIG